MSLPIFPDFSNDEIFPTFAQCPLITDQPSTNTQYLLGTIQDNMTLATHPSFICKDRLGAPYALTLKLPLSMQKEGSRGGTLDFKLYKKGWSILAKNPMVRGREEGKKQGFVEVELGESLVIPAKLDQLASMHNDVWTKAITEEGKAICQGCEQIKCKENLSRCKGCVEVWYCNKDCQTKGWSEKDHKSECKVFKALKDPLLDEARVKLITE